MDNEKERNYYRLLLLLLRVGTSKLRAYFIRKWDSVPGHRPWSDSPQDGADLTRMWKPKILPYQSIKVTSGDTSTWDLELFVKILSPVEPKESVRRALDTVKGMRNNLCHSCDAKLTNRDFQRMWNDACNALVILGAKSEDFKSVKRDAKQPLEDLKPIVVKWLAREFELLHDGQTQLLQKLVKLEEGQFTLHDKIQQSQKVILDEICEMQNATAEGTTVPDSANRSSLERRSGVTSRTPTSEGEELANFLKDHYRRGERAFLLPLPWMEGDEFHIEKIYTPPKIVEINTDQVTSLEEIFSKEENNPQDTRRILIEGEPGIGKSAICKKIAYDWCMDKNPQLFPTVEVVLSLRCREFHASSNLWDAIEKQNFSDSLKRKRKEIFEYIESNQHKVLLILDGYDEIPDKSAKSMKQSIERLIRGQLLPRSYVIVSSRPGKGSEIRNHFDRKLEIKGFELNDSFTFIRRFFLSEPENSRLSISFIEKSEAAQDLVRSPLNTAILCLLKENNEELSICNLNKKIEFSITKRYCIEKLGETEVKDGDIEKEVEEKLYYLGKMAFILMEKDRINGIEEDELEKIVKTNYNALVALFWILIGILYWIKNIFFKKSLREKVNAYNLMQEFLVHKKTVNGIRTVSCYTFPFKSLKDHLAAHYVKESLTKRSLRECKFIFDFKNWATIILFVRNDGLRVWDIVKFFLPYFAIVAELALIFVYKLWVSRSLRNEIIGLFNS